MLQFYDSRELSLSTRSRPFFVLGGVFDSGARINVFLTRPRSNLAKQITMLKCAHRSVDYSTFALERILYFRLFLFANDLEFQGVEVMLGLT